MKRIELTILLAATASVIGACGGSDHNPSSGGGGGATEGVTVSCDTPAQSDCTEWLSVSATLASQIQATCGAMSGTFGSACPTASRVGTCTRTSDGTGLVPAGTVIKWRYYAPTDAVAAQGTCVASGGTWTPG